MFNSLHKNKVVLGGGILIGLTALLASTGTLFPSHTTGALIPNLPGMYRDWTPNIAQGIVVDEQACNGTGSYDFTNTLGDRDSYSVDLSSIPDGAVIKKIQIIPCASRNHDPVSDDATVMNVFYNFSGNQSPDKGNYVLAGTEPRTLYATTFDGLLLAVEKNAPRATKPGNSTLEIGAVLSEGTAGARLSRIAAKITYTSLAK